MALVYANISCELRELILKDKPQHMLDISPKGTVPVLLTSTGQVIDESVEVMNWALSQHDPDQWLADQASSHSWIFANDHQFKPLLDAYKYADRHPQLSPEEHRNNTLAHLQKLEHKLSQSDWLLGKHIRLADIALMPFIRQYAWVDKDWFDQQPWPHLQNWLKRLLESRWFQSSMPKFNRWNDGYSYRFPEGQLLSKPPQP
jgi:glutathione S-transferase